MSAILSADDLNDFISPGVACVKPVEVLGGSHNEDGYEVTTEDRAQQDINPAQISLTDCLACSGCVTSAEAVLVSLQSHAEVLNVLDTHGVFPTNELATDRSQNGRSDTKIFVATVSAQARASLAATYNVTESEAGHMIHQLLSGPEGLIKGSSHGTCFSWVMDLNPIRDLCLALGAEEVSDVLSKQQAASPSHPTADAPNDLPQLPILTSACPGWVCYAEKTHPHVLRHLSRIKSPQALAGTLLKSVLANHYQIDPAQIWHLSIMPCFDKKLEASRQELTDASWRSSSIPGSPVRDVDCVITAREVLMLADSRGVRFSGLPRSPLASQTPFPDPIINQHLFQSPSQRWKAYQTSGTSGGYLQFILSAQHNRNPGSKVQISPGRNTDLIDFSLESNKVTLFKGARFYGFRNIQNLVRKLKPARANQGIIAGKGRNVPMASRKIVRNLDYVYVEVMACPGGCTNGGGQIKASELSELQSPHAEVSQKAWLGLVDNAYFTTNSTNGLPDRQSFEDPPFRAFQEDLRQVHDLISHWSRLVGVPKAKLVTTGYREVESLVGKAGQDTEKVAILASKIGGGW